MKGLGNKLLIFSVGILLGVILGGAAGWFIFGSGGKNIYIFNNPAKENLAKGKEGDGLDKVKAKKVVKDLNSVNKPTEKGIVNQAGAESSGEESKDNLGNDEIVKNQQNETDSVNSSLSYDESEEEIIIVKKDELLLIKTVQLIDLNSTTEILSKKDSVLQNVSGIKEPAQSGVHIIEYWKSPINYKGYKTNKNKIVVFGLVETEKPKLYKLGDDMYLKNNDKIYRIRKTTEYSMFDIVTDSSLLAKLN